MKEFFRGIFSSGTPESSKRFFGAVGFICAIIFIAIWDKTLIDTLLFTSTALLGLESITTIFNNKQNEKTK